MSKKAVTTDGSEIKRLRELKGWSAEDLADRSRLNLKTIRTAERSKGVQLSSLNLLADALGVKNEDITSKYQNRVNIQVVINLDLSKFSSEQQELLLALLKSFIPDGGDMEIKDAKPSNSIEVTIEIDRDDIPALFRELKKHVGSEGFPIIAYESDAYKEAESGPAVTFRTGVNKPRDKSKSVDIKLPDGKTINTDDLFRSSDRKEEKPTETSKDSEN